MMTRLPSPDTIQLFIRNRSKDGWTNAAIVTALRTRMKWAEIDEATLDGEQKERYREVGEMLRELERNLG